MTTSAAPSNQIQYKSSNFAPKQMKARRRLDKGLQSRVIHFARLFLTSSNKSAPFFFVVHRSDNQRHNGECLHLVITESRTNCYSHLIQTTPTENMGEKIELRTCLRDTSVIKNIR